MNESQYDSQGYAQKANGTSQKKGIIPSLNSAADKVSNENAGMGSHDGVPSGAHRFGFAGNGKGSAGQKLAERGFSHTHYNGGV